MVVLFESAEAQVAITRQVAAPWFAEHVGPYVAAPPDRRTGEVVASSAYE